MSGASLWRLPPGPLVLASSSPRRRRLLAEQGLRFRVWRPRVDERLEGDDARVEARRLAGVKAEAAAGRFPESWCLAADTLVVLGRRILGKPAGPAEARRMLGALSGRRHRVVTGVALYGPGWRRRRSVVTAVRFRPLGPGEIEAYVATGEPLDKAGAYGLQGIGAVLVAAVEGDWSNVVGLPLGAARALLAEAAEGFSRCSPRGPSGTRPAARPS